LRARCGAVIGQLGLDNSAYGRCDEAVAFGDPLLINQRCSGSCCDPSGPSAQHPASRSVILPAEQFVELCNGVQPGRFSHV
jgi:hypothetical protein